MEFLLLPVDLLEARLLEQFPEVRSFLEVFRANVIDALGNRLAGIYAQGSLALGDFNPETSDIDLVVVTTGSLEDQDQERLARMHEAMPSCPTYAYEVSYMTTDAARHPDPAVCPHLQFDGTRLKAEPQGADAAILRHVTRKNGLVLEGPPATDLFDPVPPRQLRAAAAQTLRDWWRPMLDPANPYHELVAADPRYQSYAILTMCRARYTLAFGDVVSKTKAVDWALEVLDSRWHRMIEAAQSWRPGMAAQDGSAVLSFVEAVVSAETGQSRFHARGGRKDGESPL